MTAVHPSLMEIPVFTSREVGQIEDAERGGDEYRWCRRSCIFCVRNTEYGKVIGRSTPNGITCDKVFSEKEEVITRVEYFLWKLRHYGRLMEVQGIDTYSEHRSCLPVVDVH